MNIKFSENKLIELFIEAWMIYTNHGKLIKLTNDLVNLKRVPDW